MENDLFSRLKRHWKPEPITPPTVDPDLPKLNGLQRATESLRYTILSLEWWLSPNGKLREWLRINGKVSSVLLIPAVLVVPLITFILWQVSKWSGWLVGIAGHLIVLPLALLLAAGAITVVVLVLKAVFRR